MTAAPRHDVIVLGGGLAGLTLAIQLRRRDPSITIAVVERNRHPVPEAAFKVGESTVEVGAHYFSHELGLREHLDEAQVRKFGFRFFFSDGRDDIDRCTELGVTRLLPTPSWQIDRGRFETFLGEHARALGVEFLDGAVVRTITPGTGDADHQVEVDAGGTTTVHRARWMVDASGRAGLLKRQLGLAEPNGHDANAAWWRVEGIVDPADWSDDPAWRSRCTPPDRWRSTNHMCGPGYWVWLIPLASGAHSVGIVCDAGMHPLESMKTHALATEWLRRHQPAVAASLDGREVLDFRFLRHFSHGATQLFGERWAVTGEAGMFLDPFYSPGSDFIAIANTFITDLVARDRAGQAWAPWSGIYEQLYRSFNDNTLLLYQDQYALFGDEQVMPVKVIWDYTFYWALLAPTFFARRITDVAMFGRLRDAFEAGSRLNAAMQPLLRAWGKANADAGAVPAARGRLLDQYGIDWFHEMNRALSDELDDAAFDARIRGNVARMQWLAAEILAEARAVHPELDDHGLGALVDEATGPSLDPTWYGHPDSNATGTLHAP
jgi:flavin-dependent dehydrogenase